MTRIASERPRRKILEPTMSSSTRGASPICPSTGTPGMCRPLRAGEATSSPANGRLLASHPKTKVGPTAEDEVSTTRTWSFSVTSRTLPAGRRSHRYLARRRRQARRPPSPPRSPQTWTSSPCQPVRHLAGHPLWVRGHRPWRKQRCSIITATPSPRSSSGIERFALKEISSSNKPRPFPQ